MARKPYSPKKHMFGSVLTKMREIAYGNSMKVHIHRTCAHSDALRDDSALLSEAEAKRQRKANKRLQSK